MDTDVLRWFQQVADGVTVTEVSEIDRVTQSGVSRALARLEAELGTPLLRRSGRTLRMTRAGSAFKRHVDALLHELDDGIAAVSQLIDPETGTVTVAFQRSLGPWLVADLVSTFRRDHPEVRFSLRPVADDVSSAGRTESAVDLEITAVRPTGPSGQWHRLLTEPLRLAVPGDHRLAARRAAIGLAEVAGEPFITLRPTSQLRQLGQRLCERAGFRPLVAFEGDDLPTVRGFVAAGLGVAILPVRPAQSSDSDAAGAQPQLIIDDPDAVRDIGLTWSAEHRLLPAAELFRKHVIDRARTASGRFPPAATRRGTTRPVQRPSAR